MDNKEAIKYLIAPIATSTKSYNEYLKQKEAYELAIKALEERPQGKEWLLIKYDTDKELNALIVANPEEKLPNGNLKVVKILIGDYADKIYKELTEG